MTVPETVVLPITPYRKGVSLPARPKACLGVNRDAILPGGQARSQIGGPSDPPPARKSGGSQAGVRRESGGSQAGVRPWSGDGEVVVQPVQAGEGRGLAEDLHRLEQRRAD